MKRQFRFRQDIKVSLWRSQYFDIEAESYEDALKIAENYIYVDAAADFDCIDNEMLYDTETLLYPEENGGCSTIELYNEDGSIMIGRNAEISIH